MNALLISFGIIVIIIGVVELHKNIKDLINTMEDD